MPIDGKAMESAAATDHSDVDSDYFLSTLVANYEVYTQLRTKRQLTEYFRSAVTLREQNQPPWLQWIEQPPPKG